ncbi:MAG TPA: ABC transporter permease [Parabacteroides sp.]|nr:ABC transporter permease [Parabacteroides sp.]
MNIILSLKSYLKFLGRNKVYTAIDLFGLSISLMFVLLIAVYTVQEFTTDKFQENKERIYFIGCEDAPVAGAAIPYMLKERYPEIENACPIVTDQISDLPVSVEGKKFNANITFADTSFFSMFSFPLLQGDPKNVLVDKMSIVLSQSFARKAFGTEDVVGKSIAINDSIHFTVTGVMTDLKHSAIKEADALMPWRIVGEFNPSLAPDQMGNAGSTLCAVMVHKGVDFKQKTNDILEWYKTFFWPYQMGVWKEVRMETLNDFYFSGWADGGPLNTGDRTMVLLLMSVGIIVLVFALLNYINLTVAQAGFRAKEMATCRLLGSSRMELFWRLMGESTLLCLIALGLAILLAFWVVAPASNLLQCNLDLTVLFHPEWMVVMLLTVLVVGSLAGWLPAVVISSAKPIDIVKGTLRVKTKMVFSKVFITFQNFITIVMLSCSFAMILQINHLIKAPLGYNTKNIFVVGNTALNPTQSQTFLNKSQGISGVSRAGMSMGLPMFGSNNSTNEYLDGGIKKNISFQQYVMDHNAFDILGLKVLQDNHLSTPSWYLNETAMKEMNLPKDATDFSLVGRKEAIPIAGIISDFHERNATSRIAPVMFMFDERGMRPWHFIIEITGNPYETVKEIEKTYEELSGGAALSGEFMDNAIQASFESQIRMAKIVTIVTVIGIIISLLGLLAMSTYFIQQRSLEIAVRKVFGSETKQVWTQLVKTFLIYVIIAFVFAIPVSWYVMNDWLSSYSYRISLNPLIFLAAGLFCLLISFLTVFLQSKKAAERNPIDSFRHKE